MNDEHTYLGTSPTGYGSEPFALTREERFEHVALLGSTGVGKSSLAREMAARDIARGDGVLYLDVHGEDVELLLDRIPPARWNHVCLIDLSQLDWVVAFNILEAGHTDDHAQVADALVVALRDIWSESWGPRLETILRHAALALLDVPHATALQIPRLLTDDEFRRDVVERISKPLTRRFFTDRFEEWRDVYRDEAIEPVLNKLDVLTFPAVLYSLGQHRRTLSLERAMQGRRIILVNLARGILGETGASLMGALLLARVRTAAMSRARIAPEQRADFHVFADEIQTYATNSIPAALAELRKFRVSLTFTTQILSVLSERTRAALLGTTGTLAAFRVGPEDAQAISPKFDELHRAFNTAALNELEHELERGEAMIKIGARDVRRVLTPAPGMGFGTAEIVRRQARRHYARPRHEIERWMQNEC
jgi:hypothetical protein